MRKDCPQNQSKWRRSRDSARVSERVIVFVSLYSFLQKLPPGGGYIFITGGDGVPSRRAIIRENLGGRERRIGRST
jgi:hypothetical protein